jgi:hypothetical protein
MAGRRNSRRRRLLASVFVTGSSAGAVLVIALGAALLGGAPAADAVTVYTRSASCAGLDFYPTDSGTEYSNSSTLRIRTSGAGTGVFRCDPGLLTGAHVTKVQFTFANPISPWDFYCNYVRSGLTVATATSFDVIAHAPEAPSGPVVRVSTTAISNGTIDNSKYGYWLECQLPITANTGLYGADVIYTISAANG